MVQGRRSADLLGPPIQATKNQTTETMTYDELTIFAAGFLTAAVVISIITLVLTATQKPQGTTFSGSDVEMLHRLLDENNVHLTKND
jgi:hypothetical protein